VRGTNFCTDALLGAIYAERGLMAVTADMEHLRHCLPRECVTSGTRVGALLARAVRRRRPGTAAGRRHRQRSCRHGRQDPHGLSIDFFITPAVAMSSQIRTRRAANTAAGPHPRPRSFRNIHKPPTWIREDPPLACRAPPPRRASRRAKFAVKVGGGHATVHEEVAAGDERPVGAHEQRADGPYLVWGAATSDRAQLDHAPVSLAAAVRSARPWRAG
jgi:hypothetical protein